MSLSTFSSGFEPTPTRFTASRIVSNFCLVVSEFLTDVAWVRQPGIFYLFCSCARTHLLTENFHRTVSCQTPQNPVRSSTWTFLTFNFSRPSNLTVGTEKTLTLAICSLSISFLDKSPTNLVFKGSLGKCYKYITKL